MNNELSIARPNSLSNFELSEHVTSSDLDKLQWLRMIDYKKMTHSSRKLMV